jgi:hypothetical protein
MKEKTETFGSFKDVPTEQIKIKYRTDRWHFRVTNASNHPLKKP